MTPHVAAKRSPVVTSHEHIVPPESPAYIRFPQPAQSDETKGERIRGRLPQPREIFSKEEGQRKLTKAFMEQTVSRGKQREPTSDRQAQKKMMADHRRRNLESGIKLLWQRKVRRDYKEAQLAKHETEANLAARAAPERKDDAMTRSTVHSSILDTTVHPDPKRFAEADRSRTRVANREIAKREARRDALMELYVNASDFIVSESGLRTEVERIFAEDYFKKQSNALGKYGVAENVWGAYGKPDATREWMQSTAAQSGLMDEQESHYDRAAKRQKRISEELTGGKMK